MIRKIKVLKCCLMFRVKVKALKMKNLLPILMLDKMNR